LKDSVFFPCLLFRAAIVGFALANVLAFDGCGHVLLGIGQARGKGVGNGNGKMEKENTNSPSNGK